MELDHLSPSGMRTLWTCEQRFYFDKTNRIRTASRPAELGSAFHKYMELTRHQQHRFILNEPDLWDLVSKEYLTLDLFDRARLHAMALKYYQELDPWEEVLECESEQNIGLYKGIRDVIVKNMTGKWIVDLKTSGRPTIPEAEDIAYTPQMMMYVLFDHEAKGVCYRSIKTPTERPKVKETWDEFRDRIASVEVRNIWVPREDFDLAEAQRFWLHSLDKAKRSLEMPNKNYFACWDCQYKEQCHG